LFVLDGLRQLKDGELTIPSFHLGHLGFRPGLEVDSQYSDIRSSNGYIDGHELTLTPFQGSRKDLFLFKCIFKEQPGVVARALSAFVKLGLNILSLESATIDKDSKHVLFCILSWASSSFPDPVTLEESTKHKFIDLLPLLPTFDNRYVDLIEEFLAHCFNAIEFEQIPGGRLSLPRISIRLFDDFYSPEKIKQLKIFRNVPEERHPLPEVKVTLVGGGINRAPKSDAYALLFSETETKALHVIFPRHGRETRFLHIGFVHSNKPGALLLIATLLQFCGFSIKTCLLRQHERADTNVWEVMIEHVGDIQGSKSIPTGKQGVIWFRDWCFDKKNPNAKEAINLVPNLHAYGVRICRPTYPRRYDDSAEEFEEIDLTSNVGTPLVPELDGSTYKGPPHFFLRGMIQMSEAMGKGTSEKGSWIAKLIYPKLDNRINFMKGRVFLSIPTHCTSHIELIKAKFKSELKLKVTTYTTPDASRMVSEEALSMIKNADYFFGVWHHEKGNPSEMSPWLPFELGAAMAMGKKFHIIAHKSLPADLTNRIEKNYALIHYDDMSFPDDVMQIVSKCRSEWDAR
jgi:hypothetical protein